ncbi:hypothetical protein V6O07_17080, partial [Arthrospira platensis SPKY2]
NNILPGVGVTVGNGNNNLISNTTYLHEGDKNIESNIIINGCTKSYGSICGYYEVLDPENLSDDDYVAFRYNDNIPPKEFSLKGSNFFKVSQYRIPVNSSNRLYIKSRAKIIFYDLQYVEGGCFNPKSFMGLAIRLQDLISVSDNFTIIYDIEFTMGHDKSNGYMISC